MGGQIGRLLDPVNITGMADQTGNYPGRGSTIGLTAGTPEDHGYNTNPNLTPTAPAWQDGFISSMGGWGGENLMRPDMAPMPPPPPSHWSYDPQKGASWATPKRNANSTGWEYENNAPGSEGFNSYKGNRI